MLKASLKSKLSLCLLVFLASPIYAQDMPISRGEVQLGGSSILRSAKGSRVQQAQNLSSSLAVWRDPKFKRRFAESYMAETDIEPAVTTIERDVMIKVLELISTEKMAEALDLLKEQQKAPNSNAVFDFTAANIHFQSERFPQAAELYKSACAKYPKFRRAWKNLAMIYVRDNKFVAALPALTRVVTLGGGDAVIYGLLGFSYANTGNDIAAESAFRLANLLAPETMDWKMGLARSFFKQGRFADAAALCKSLIENHPDRADMWMLLANAHLGMKEPMRAAEDLEIVKRLGKANAASLNLLGDIYVNEELYPMAVDAYLAALKKSKKASPDRIIRAAKILAARSALNESKALIDHIEKTFSKTLATNDKKDLLKIRARIAVAQGSGGEEVAVLEEIVKLDPLDGEALLLLGKHYSKGEQKEKAVFYFERAANLEKFEADAKVYHAQVLVAQGKYNQAIPLLRRAQTLKPRENINKYLEQVERIAKKR